MHRQSFCLWVLCPVFFVFRVYIYLTRVKPGCHIRCSMGFVPHVCLRCLTAIFSPVWRWWSLWSLCSAVWLCLSCWWSRTSLQSPSTGAWPRRRGGFWWRGQNHWLNPTVYALVKIWAVLIGISNIRILLTLQVISDNNNCIGFRGRFGIGSWLSLGITDLDKRMSSTFPSSYP